MKVLKSTSYGLGFGFHIQLRDVHKYSDLVAMQTHRLNFILDLKAIIFNKINY
jgi:hypothetical protein